MLPVVHHVEAVRHGLGTAVVAPSEEDTLGLASARELAAEHAALDIDVARKAVAQDAADVRRATHNGGDSAVHDTVARTCSEAHDASGVHVSYDGAIHNEVFDGGPVDVVERGEALALIVSDVGCQHVAAAVEGPPEGMVARTHSGRDADVGGQCHHHATVVETARHNACEGIPVCRGADG